MRYAVPVLLMMALTAPGTTQIGYVSEKDLQATVTSYVDAFSRLDAAAMDRLETEDFVLMQDGVMVTKRQQMASLKATERKLTNAKFALSFGESWVVADSAVITGTMTVTAPGAEALPGTFTHLLRRSATEWRIQHAHYSTRRPNAAPK